MEPLGLILFYLVAGVGALIILFGLPGIWVIWIAVSIFAWVSQFNTTDWIVVALTLVMAIVAEAMEFAVGVLGSKKMEVSNGAIMASIVGGIIGAVTGFPVFLIGSIIGMFVGVFLGAFFWEVITTQKIGPSLKKATAATFSRAVSVFVKFSIGLVIIAYVSLNIF